MSMLHHQKPKKKNTQLSQSKAGGNRVLIKVNVLGSTGPLRFLVNEEELVAAVIDTALKSYAREGRLPVLGSDLNNFLLYCSNAECHALKPWEKIGSYGVRNFVLYKKPEETTTTTTTKMGISGNKGSGNWKAWLNRKSLIYSKMISSH
ncbi:hypothetical protein BVC80_9071g31 [Macleaya cordata]|uniref:DUF7054 domain-containing protein n=1 Tax=Macleaya cordata TaxID=56857 RepID=A0A200PU33_MACCD|nr:hypothetical protein BVC80_9071g29 [Macleaya cordata]OVA01711.1 hypothetical protein BVC80_9071g31 [Macleaya cordata]